MELLEIKPKISVIIPFYNAKIYLERCVRSLFLQTFSEMEFVFVDDCSSDHGASLILEILSEYPERQHQVKIVTHKQRYGVAQARNAGLKNATGECIGWCDADDWVEATMFSDLYNAIERELADLVWCNFYMDFTNHQVLKQQEIEFDPKKFSQALIDGRMQGMLWNKLVKAHIIRKDNLVFLDGCDMGEDRNFLFKILCHVDKVVHIPVAYYHYVQQNSNSLTQKIDAERIYEEVGNVSDTISYIQNNNIWWISDKDIKRFKFRTKLRLLYSSTIEDFKAWNSIFNDSNRLVYSYPMRLRHRFLAVSARCRMWLVIRFWVYLKQRNNGK